VIARQVDACSSTLGLEKAARRIGEDTALSQALLDLADHLRG
jgi:hypothetical protein